jgi:hypothetical protein
VKLPPQRRRHLQALGWVLFGLSLAALQRYGDITRATSAPLQEATASPEETAVAQPTNPVYAAFTAWSERFRVTNGGAADADGLRAGRALALERRVALKALIQSDPEAALALRVPHDLRVRLPAEIQTLLEEPVNTAGVYRVSIACGFHEEGHVDAVERFAQWAGRTVHVFTHGDRLDVASKRELSLVGIAVDDVMALEKTPVRLLDERESAAWGAAPGVWIAEGMGERRAFRDPRDVDSWQAALQADEGALGPGGVTASASPAPLSNYTEGDKSLLYIICDFPNLTGFGTSRTAISNAMNTVTSFFQQASYGKMRMTPTYVPGVLRLPKNGELYTNAFSTLMADAESVALAAGYDTDNYDFYVVLTAENASGINFSYAGKAWIGNKGCHLVDPNYTLRTAGHELGHNFGLRHANYWRTDSDLPNGRDKTPGGYVGDATNAEWIDYGHQFTMMSGQAGTYMTPAAHFAPVEKRHLDWLSEDLVLRVTNSQTVRLYRFDHVNTIETPQAIQINLPSSDYTGNQRRYWLCYRRAFQTNAWLTHGLQVDWVKSTYGSDGAIQLDMTPYSNDDNTGATYTDDLNDKNDGTLLIGRTASDIPAGIHVTPLARGGTEPDEWIEVAIHVGNFTNNRPPTLRLEASATNAANNGALVFTASASDADGDALAYAWDFGLPRLFFSNSLNQAVVTNSWGTAGEYLVRCVASDMKGGRASTSLLVRIGNPSAYRISGRVLANGRGVENVRVYTAHTNMTYTDSDGRYSLANLRAATFNINAQYAGQLLTAAFDGPVAVGPSAWNKDFGFTGTPALVVDDLDGLLSVKENGGADTCAIRLGNRPATNVTIQLTWDTNQVRVTPGVISLAPNDWLTGCVVNIEAVDDTLFEAPIHTSLVALAAGSVDPVYHGLGAPASPVQIVDNDSNAPPAALFASPLPDSQWAELQSVPIRITATDGDGSVTQVVLYVNETAAAAWTTPPFTTTVTHLSLGTNHLHTTAWDQHGAGSITASIAVVVMCDTDKDGVPDCDDPDDDGDGLSDVYETHHFGNSTNAQPHLDADLDGFSNLSEAIADTDPTNSLSFFHLLIPTPGHPDRYTVPSAVGRIYTLQASSGLAAGNTWSNITGQVNIPGTGADLILTDPQPEALRIYRLWVTLP